MLYSFYEFDSENTFINRASTRPLIEMDDSFIRILSYYCETYDRARILLKINEDDDKSRINSLLWNIYELMASPNRLFNIQNLEIFLYILSSQMFSSVAKHFLEQRDTENPFINQFLGCVKDWYVHLQNM